MSLAPPRPLRAAVFFPARALSRCAAATPRGSPSSGRACCLFSGGGKQEEALRAPKSALGQNKDGFDKWGMSIERRRRPRRNWSGSPRAARGGGRGGGGGGDWFRWFSSGEFWDAAKQTVLTILGIIAAFFLIANFNVLVAAVVNPLLVVLRQIRRALSFAAHCVSRGMPTLASDPKPTSASGDGGSLAAAPVKGGVGMSAKERVIRKWGT